MPLTIEVARTTDFDANGDGLPDLVVGVPGEDVGLATNAGAVNIFFGGPERPLRLSRRTPDHPGGRRPAVGTTTIDSERR